MAESNEESRVVWFCAGVAVGATIALLFAPQSGEETRNLIKTQANKGRDRLTDKGKELAGRSRDLYEKGRSIADEAADMFERGKRMVEG